MSSNKYDLIIFDLDGTLLNTKEGIVSSVKYTIEKMGYKEISDKEIDSFIGPPIQDSFAREYGISGDELQVVATTFRDRYKYHDLYKAEVYEGIVDVLSEIKKRGMLLAVATYKREDYAKMILKHFNIDGFFDVIHGADHENILKKSDIVRMCVEETGIRDKERVLLIGDTENDEKGAKAIGVNFLGVLYGFGYREETNRSDANEYAREPKEILEYI